jgi:hypothetical protein
MKCKNISFDISHSGNVIIKVALLGGGYNCRIIANSELVQFSKLLLVLANTVVLSFEPHQGSLNNLCSFPNHLCV